MPPVRGSPARSRSTGVTGLDGGSMVVSRLDRMVEPRQLAGSGGSPYRCPSSSGDAPSAGAAVTRVGPAASVGDARPAPGPRVGPRELQFVERCVHVPTAAREGVRPTLHERTWGHPGRRDGRPPSRCRCVGRIARTGRRRVLTVRRRIPFNLCPECADGRSMSDVEATRYMASERDIEFVDLDTYGVDPDRGGDPAGRRVAPSPRRRREAEVRHAGHRHGRSRRPARRGLDPGLPGPGLHLRGRHARADRQATSTWCSATAARRSPPRARATSRPRPAVPDDAFDQALAEASLAADAPPPAPRCPHSTSRPRCRSPASRPRPLSPARPRCPTARSGGRRPAGRPGRARSSRGDDGRRRRAGTNRRPTADAADLVAEAVANYQTQHPRRHAGPTETRRPRSRRWPRRWSRAAGCRSRR